MISQIINQKCICVTSFESFKSDLEDLQTNMKWDVMIIDEGHKAKNVKTQLRKALKTMKVQIQKIVLTGTPVQNNLNEFWSIIDLV